MKSEDFAPLTHRAAFNFLCDKPLGNGMSRQVFSTEVLSGCVIKVEERAGFFQNIIEWETWQRVKETDYAKHFAKCFNISPDGRLLIMERTEPVHRSMLPARMPAFFTDFKLANYGIVPAGAREGVKVDLFVCHDYGTSLIFENGLTKRTKAVQWRIEE
jgi:hypothetical protein